MVGKMQVRKKGSNRKNRGRTRMGSEPKDYLKVLENQVHTLLGSIKAHNQALQNAYSELGAERYASATAIDEAALMISRLQRDKSRLAIEASQYRREAEQTIASAEEALGFYHDLLLGADEEITALQCEIQRYRNGLLSYGVSDKTLRVSEPCYCQRETLRVSEPCYCQRGIPDVGIQDQFYDKGCVECDIYVVTHEKTSEVAYDNGGLSWDEKQSEPPMAQDEGSSVIFEEKCVLKPIDCSLIQPRPSDEYRELKKYTVEKSGSESQVEVEEETLRKEEAMIAKKWYPSKGSVLASFIKTLMAVAVLGCSGKILTARNKCSRSKNDK